MSQPSRFFYDFFDTPIGPLWMVSSQAGLSFLLWRRSHSDLLSEMKQKTGCLPQKDSKYSAPWQILLRRYFSGEPVSFHVPIAFLEGSAFQQAVWRALMDIPYGEVRSYQSIADQLDKRGGARAVGRACGKNPLPIVVPCHRVIRKDGAIGGYTGGVDIKNRLLAIEGIL
ncbi:MAG: methylated-DNA--[protein]-cysteine S-methyltransferase [Nitrospiria bacterium]